MADRSIAGLAREVGVGVETVRYYQRRGLLEVPARALDGQPGSGVRRYSEDHVRRLRFIRAAKAAGFTLEQIGELLVLDANNDRVRARGLATDRVAALDATILQLQAARDALARLAEECASGVDGPCPILSAFDGRSTDQHVA